MLERVWKKGNLLYCWWEWKSIMENSMKIILKSRNKITIWPSNPTTGHILWEKHNWKRHMYPNVHCSTVQWLGHRSNLAVHQQMNGKRCGTYIQWTIYSTVSSVQLLNCSWLFATPWTAARQASLSITSSQSLFKLMSIESVMPSNHLILFCPLLLPSFFPASGAFPMSQF